jgi:hypothetical protein
VICGIGISGCTSVQYVGDFCLIYEPMLPSREDTDTTARHMNAYYEIWERECR